MKFVGEYLKSVRINKKCTIEKLSNELNINQNTLEKIELDVFPEYIDSVYMMGYIRSYANFFDLDADDLIENFKIQTSYNKSNENKVISKPVKNINLLSLSKTFYFASIATISISFYFMFIRPNNLDSQYAMTPDLPENLESSLEKIQMNLLLSQKNNILKNLSLKSKEIENFEIESDLSNSSSALASASKDFIIKDDYRITLNFLNSTWIQLRDINDNIIISKLMNEEDEFSYNVSENLNLTAGNAGNIIISLNGLVKGKVGKAGDVIESFVIDKNFNN